MVSLFSAYSLAASIDTMTYEQALNKLKRYDYNKSRTPLYVIETHMQQVAADIKQKERLADELAEILAADESSFATKQFICEQLQWIGADKQVPLLAKMLHQPETFEIARRALQSIPGEKAGAVLLQALDQYQQEKCAAIINALGKNRDEPVTKKLSELLNNKDRQVAIAAARALGRLGSPQASAALSQAESNAPKPLKTVIIQSLIQCADRCADRNNIEEADKIFRQLYKTQQPARIRMAGLSGLVKIHKEKAIPQIVDALTGEDYPLQTLAVKLTHQMPGPGVTKVLVEQLKNANPRIRPHLIRALADRADISARSAIVGLTFSDDLPTRLAAIEATGSLGNASNVELLANIAAQAHDIASETARQSLKRLTGPEVDAAILTAAKNATPQIRAVLITALADRQVTAAVELLIEACHDPTPEVRTASQKALAVLAQPKDYNKLIELLQTTKPDERKNLEKALAAIGRKIDNPNKQVEPLKKALINADPDLNISILRILGDSNLPQALKIIRTHIDDSNPKIQDAAIRTLADCSSREAADDLFKLVTDSDNATHRTLALRGYVRLAKKAGEKSPALSLEMFRKVIPLAKSKEDKTGILSGLAESTDAQALKLASSFMENQDVSHEAALAILKISKTVVKKHPAAVKLAMKQILGLSKDKEINTQARQLLQKTKGR
jgi:HEAT repeat protein